MKSIFDNLAPFVGLLFCLALILGATVFARWLRTKIIFSRVGEFLVRCGLANAVGTLDDLVEGKSYLIKKDFRDFYGNQLAAGEILTFRSRDYSPFNGGNVLEFAEKSLYLQREAQAEILREIYKYLEPVR